MTEPTSSMTRLQLVTEISRQCKATVADSLSNLQLYYRDFLYSWPWGFVCPSATIAIVASTATSDLPDDFAEIVEWPSFPSVDGNGPIVEQVDLKRILDRRAYSSETGPPRRFALEAKTFVPATGQRYTIRWDPTPNANKTLLYRYRIIQPLLANDTDYPAGGPPHNLTLIEGALAQWESSTGNVAGVHHNLHDIAWAKSLAFEKRLRTGITLGTLIATPPLTTYSGFQVGAVTEV